MSFTKRARAWFFRSNAPLNAESKKINFQDNQRPDQGSFEELTASYLNFSEADDRAKTNTGVAIADEVGTVAVTSDVKAKANTSGFESDRTLVVHAAQLPTPEIVSDTIDDFTGNSLLITKEVAVTTRSNNQFQLATAFKSWLLSRLMPGGGADDAVLTKTSATDYAVAWEAPATAAIVVEEEGSTVGTTTQTLNFIGSAVTAADAGGNETTVTITDTDTNTVPVWSSLDGGAIELYYAGGDVVSAGLSAVIANWDDTGGTKQSYLNYYIMDKVIHFTFRFDFTVDFTPALTGSDEVVLRVGISPPSGETFVHSRGGMCMKSYAKDTVTAMHIGNFDGTDLPLVTSHVTGEKIFFEVTRKIDSSKTIKFTGEFTAQLA